METKHITVTWDKDKRVSDFIRKGKYLFL